MLAPRSALVPAGALAGVALAAALWLAVGTRGPALAAVNTLHAHLAAAAPAALPGPETGSDASLRAAAAPLFNLTTGPGAVAETPISIAGISVTPGRRAVLASINGAPADWLDLNAMRDGVTLLAVTGTGATFDTATGFKDVGIGTANPAPAPAAPPPAPPVMRTLPPAGPTAAGFRPPPPAAQSPAR